jgi:phosphatidylinositol 3-kinase
VKNSLLGNRFHWYLMVELEDKVMGKMYAHVAYKFMTKMMEVWSSFDTGIQLVPKVPFQLENGAERRDLLRRQGELIATLSSRAKELRTSKDARPKKIDKLRAFIADSKNGLTSMTPLTCPLNARVELTGMVAEKSTVFKSNLSPLLLWFQTTGGGEYPVIFKNGDDMRQDQLVIQLFTLMDRLLRKENLDLKLSPYDVLATGALEGMVQYIPSKTIATIVSEHTTLLNYLRAHNPDEGTVGTYGVTPSVIDTFVRSCGKLPFGPSRLGLCLNSLFSWLLRRHVFIGGWGSSFG